MIPKIYTVPIQHLASGDRLSIQVYQFAGTHPGKKAYLQANLHGAEIVGNAVIHQLIELLTTLEDSQLTGEIWLVPVCNPNSTNQRTHCFSTGRYNVVDGKDWNRIFWDYEHECEDLEAFARSQLDKEIPDIRSNYLSRIQASFAQQGEKINSPSGLSFNHRYRYQLQSLCLDANYVIDIHSASYQAIDYLYCCAGREESAKAFLLDYAILLNEYHGGTFDEVFIKSWLALEKQLADLGREVKFDIESWTLELGSGMQMNPESVVKGVRGIKNYLATQGMLDIPSFPLPETGDRAISFTPKSQLKTYYAPMGGMVQERVELGTKVKAGDRLYQLLVFNKEGKLPEVIDVFAETDGLVFAVSTNHAVNQGEYLLDMM